MTEEEKEEIILYILNKNGYDYNIRKVAEELQELALVLTQKSLKPHKVKDYEIIEEIGDCILRMEVISRLFDTEAINARIDYKLKKYKELIETIEGVKI